MSESILATALKKQKDTIFLKDYQAPPFLIDDIDLTVDLQNEFTIVRSKLRIRKNRYRQTPSKDLLLNGEELTLIEIFLDEKRLNENEYQVFDNYLLIKNVPTNFELQITNKIFPQKNTALQGLYRSKNIYCTQCEAEGFRRITYFLDRPDVLSKYTTTIIADKAAYPYLLSNGNLIETGLIENNRHWAKWEDPFKKPCYLFALVAGDFDLLEKSFVTQSKHEVDLRLFVEKGYLSQSQHAMNALIDAMRWDEKSFGREYDLDVYMIVAIGDFNMGAMENKGLNIFNTKYILARPETATDDDYIHIVSVVGHEYFHNWSGNRVTCRDWFQLSLKEGLTIFRDQSFTEDLFSQAVMRIRDVRILRESQFPEDAGPLAHPVMPDAYIEINNFYTMTIYHKGAEVIRMLQTLLTKQFFRKGMDLYFARYDGQAVTIEEFILAMEDVSGSDLSQFRRWYHQAGTPIINIEDDYNAQEKIYTLSVHQHCNPTPNQAVKEPFLIPIRFGLLNEKGESLPLYLTNEEPTLEKTLILKERTQLFRFNNVLEKPIPSLFRNFSAPVRVNYRFSDTDLKILMMHDTDLFNRFEAAQSYSLKQLMQLIKDYQQENELEILEEVFNIFKWILNVDIEDKFFLSELLIIPSEKYISEQMEVIDVEAIHTVREVYLTSLVQQLQTVFLEKYNQFCSLETDEMNINAIGCRQFKNRCLSYLLHLPQYDHLGYEQFERNLNVNMTNTQVALIGLANSQSDKRLDALNLFYDTWKKEALVVDKWFAIQAASKLPNTLIQVKKLMRHEAFDIKNPNKVYSLIGTFGRNEINFHLRNGEGYAFLRETVEHLDEINPQVASRMIAPLTTWRRYDKERQVLMRSQLEIILNNKKISPDLYELVTKSLERSSQ